MTLTISGKNFIGAQLSADGTKKLKTMNPQLNEENPWEFTEATPEEIERAILKAHHAFKVYREIPGKEKAIFLSAIADEIAALGNSLIEVYCLESGLPKGRAENERNRTMVQLHSFAEMLREGSWVHATIDTAALERQPLPREDLRKMLVP